MGRCVVNELATRLGIVVPRFRIQKDDSPPNVGFLLLACQPTDWHMRDRMFMRIPNFRYLKISRVRLKF